MTGLYIFALAAGFPLLLMFVFTGEDFDSGNEPGSGKLGQAWTIISLSTIALMLTFFGATGTVLSALKVSTFFSFPVALIVGAGAATLNHLVFKWLRKTEASSEVTDKEIEGTIAEVLMPISNTQRGRIVLTLAGARTQMTARPVDNIEENIPSGSRVLIVGVQGGVALVEPLPPELEYSY